VSRGQRIAILVVAVVVLAGGFALAQSVGGDDGDRAQPPPAQTTPQTAEQAPPGEPEATEPEPEPRVDEVRIRDGGPAGEARTLRWRSGETIRLRFRSNVADEVHIHGYDRYVDVPADGAATTRFEATAEGIFEIESHTTHELLARLEVRP
jgi:Ni/Co efflux regulator RcnB